MIVWMFLEQGRLNRARHDLQGEWIDHPSLSTHFPDISSSLSNHFPLSPHHTQTLERSEAATTGRNLMFEGINFEAFDFGSSVVGSCSAPGSLWQDLRIWGLVRGALLEVFERWRHG
ncbi:hypothetical protein Droror1_Dr00020549 [Drosera rotundifolia]